MGCNTSKATRVVPPCAPEANFAESAELSRALVAFAESAESSRATVPLPPDLDKASIAQPESSEKDASKTEGNLGEAEQDGAPSKESVLSQLKALFDANAHQDQTVNRTHLVNSIEKHSLLLNLIEEAGLVLDFSVLREPDVNGNENISWGAFEIHLKDAKVDEEQCKSGDQPATVDDALTTEEVKAAEAAAAKRLEGVFGKMGVKQQPADDSKLPMVGDTRSVAAMLCNDAALPSLIVEAGLSSFCFILERLADKGVVEMELLLELLLEELDITVVKYSFTAQASETALDGPAFLEAEPQPMVGAPCCQTHQPQQP